MAGWTLLHLKLGASGDLAQLVIQHSATDYIGPVATDFTAVCAMPEAHAWEKFEQTCQRYGKARIYLESSIEAEGRILARHTGGYVAVRRRS
jgi:thioesterase domain-containing protein